ncbi:glycosyltransferase family 25 protein [Acinetobacter sp. RF15A]|uniref:glycosyltransferase family 25 protein n=1 Tax=unclassified Acinetobacter TaxID=196816 RepID=UPI00116D9FC0|nr:MULTISPECIES: glycosyltransferase family 25 protein [unclassified Acinetobacter]TQR61954.1 glycosyltransferase family 25 protein [Acinetobacter sp. RF14B]TSH74699.1 glycosyltransferase family 25 protein [Acinetobacter sp. RF15A]TSI17271.1 glycosyltransferase family 25 protein [Acinetobacter sp. RF15B]
MNTYVISLKFAADRRAHILNQFNSKSIPFNFFEAIEPPLNKKLLEKFKLDTKPNKLTENETACFLSHFSLWNKVIEENLNYIVIFEDDIYLSDEANYFLSMEWPIKKDIIKIEKVYKNIFLKKNKKINISGSKYTLGILLKGHLGAGGYVLSNKAAKDLIAYVENLDELDHIDQILFNHYLKSGNLPVYQLNPVICIQDCILNKNNQKFDSNLQWRNKEKISYSLFQKIIREIKRLFKQLILYPYKKEIFFKKI